MDSAKFIKACRETLDQMGSDAKVRSYSGRGMYSKQCVGIETDESIFKFTVGLCLTLGEEAEQLLDVGDPKSDSMGMGSIIYFPRMEWTDEEEGDEDCEDDEPFEGDEGDTPLGLAD